MNKKDLPGFSRAEIIILAIVASASMVVATGIQMGNVLFPSLSRLMDVPVSTVTFLVSVWAFTGLLSPLFGPPSDRFGHSTFVLVGLGAFTLGNLLCAIAPSFPALLVFQVLVGLGYAVFSFSASAVIGDAFAYETRARAMGIVGLAQSMVSLVCVPAAAAIAERATARGSFGTVGAVGLVVLVGALILLPRIVQQTAPTQPDEPKIAFRQAVKGIARHRSAIAGLIAYLAWMAIPTGVFIYLAAWLEQTFQLTETQIGLAFAMAGIGSLIGNLLTTVLADRWGKKRSSIFGLLLMSGMAMLFPHFPIVITALVGFVVFVAALVFSQTSFITLMTELTPTTRGTLMSSLMLANGIGTGVVPLLMRSLWESGGYTAITLVLGIVGVGVATIIGLFVTERATFPQATN